MKSRVDDIHTCHFAIMADSRACAVLDHASTVSAVPLPCQCRASAVHTKYKYHVIACSSRTQHEFCCFEQHFSMNPAIKEVFNLSKINYWIQQVIASRIPSQRSWHPKLGQMLTRSAGKRLAGSCSSIGSRFNMDQQTHTRNQIKYVGPRDQISVCCQCQSHVVKIGSNLMVIGS